MANKIISLIAATGMDSTQGYEVSEISCRAEYTPGLSGLQR
jgi:hypothetical protein